MRALTLEPSVSARSLQPIEQGAERVESPTEARAAKSMTASSSSTASPLRQEASTRSQVGALDAAPLLAAPPRSRSPGCRTGRGRWPPTPCGCRLRPAVPRPAGQQQQEAPPVVGVWRPAGRAACRSGARGAAPASSTMPASGARGARSSMRRWPWGGRRARVAGPARPPDRRHQPARASRRWRGGRRVQGHGARGGLAGACKFGQRRALLARHRLPLRRLRGVA